MDGGPHLEGSYFNNFENEPLLLKSLYDTYNSAISLTEVVTANHNTHSTSVNRWWDRKLDYIFTNKNVASGSGTTYQGAIQETIHLSDHAPVSCAIILE